MFAKDLSNPPAAGHQGTKTRSLIIIKFYFLCLGAFVAILCGLSGYKGSEMDFLIGSGVIINLKTMQIQFELA